MWSGLTSVGLPSFSAYDAFISGIVFSAFTIAQPIRWVKETLPPRARLRWLLMTMRLSISSLTGTCRTLVAVGTWRLVSMFCAVRAGAPRRICRSASRAGRGSRLGLALGGWFTVPPVGAPVSGRRLLRCGLSLRYGGLRSGRRGLSGRGGGRGLRWRRARTCVVPRLGASGVLLSDTASGRGASAGVVFTGFASYQACRS